MIHSRYPTVSALWLTLVAFIVLQLLAAALGFEPPAVPLDPDGHTAPFCETPLFGI